MSLFGTTVTLGHLLLCLIVSYGAQFSKTPMHAYSVLCCLIMMFLMIRFFKCCIMTPLEQSSLILNTTKIGRSFLVKDFTKIPLTDFEEITVGNAILTQIIRMALMFTLPSELLF